MSTHTIMNKIRELTEPQQDLLQAIIAETPWDGPRINWKVFQALIDRELITPVYVGELGVHTRYYPSPSVADLFWTIFPERHQVQV